MAGGWGGETDDLRSLSAAQTAGVAMSATTGHERDKVGDVVGGGLSCMRHERIGVEF